MEGSDVVVGETPAGWNVGRQADCPRLAFVVQVTPAELQRSGEHDISYIMRLASTETQLAVL
jgi:hypothetical protein